MKVEAYIYSLEARLKAEMIEYSEIRYDMNDLRFGYVVHLIIGGKVLSTGMESDCDIRAIKETIKTWRDYAQHKE